MDIREIKNFLIVSITNAVRDIQQTIFKVEVKNQIEIPKEIEVKNLKDVQEISGKVEVKKIDEVISNLKKIKEKEIKIPKPLEEIKIKDFNKLINKKEKDIIIPDRIKIENLEDIIKILEDIKNKKIPEPKEVKIPDNVRISNLKEIPKTDEVNIKNLDQLLEVLRKINFTSYNPENPIAVRLSDGKYFYKTLTEIVNRVVGGGGASVVGLRNKDNEKINPATEDKQDDIITGLDEVEILKNKGTISTNNSTTTPLGIDEVFTGEAENVLNYGEVNILVKSDQASAVNGLSIEFSPDGINWDEKIPVNITAGRAESYGFGNRADYFRLVYTNGGVAQGYFRLHSTFHPIRTRRGARCLCIDIDPAEFAPTRRAVLAAKKPDGTYTNIHSTSGGNLKVAIEESEVDFPVGTGSNGSVTLTSANTAYAIPATASTKNHILILYNGSDTDMFVGYENNNANGILLPAGGKMAFDLGISQQVYAYCASAGKVLTYSYKELT